MSQVKSLNFNFFYVALTLSSSLAFGAEKSIGRLGNIIGNAQISRQGKTMPAVKGMPVFASDSLQTAEKTAVKIQFEDGGTFMAFENSKVKIAEYKFQAGGEGEGNLKSAFEIAKGKVRFFVKPQPKGNVETTYKTANAVMGIRGTSGFIDASKPGETQLVVLTGKVEVSNPANPLQKVLVPALQMTQVNGAAGVPTAPKLAPVALMTGLNSEANRVDPKGSGGDAQSLKANSNKDESKKDESKKGESKKDESKKDESKKDESKKDESKNQGDLKKEETKKEDPKIQGELKNGSDASTGGDNKSVKGTSSESTPMERKTVYSPDGSTSMVVGDDKLTAITTPTVSNRSSNVDVSGNILAAPQQAIQQIQSAVTGSSEKILINQNEIQTKAITDSENSAKTKNVKVKIVMPQLP